ncbi:MAG TPA: hypothetical protein VG826_02515 [Pirellulales bacterium]|nr:hypothetical protein [Pirellulales bacterium]
MGKRKRRKRVRATVPANFNEVMQLVRSESDRGCVLAMATLIDTMLEVGLRERFQKDSGVTEEFLDELFTKEPMPLLGSSYALALVARARGTITERMKESLAALRLLRNDAAHLAEDFAIDDDAIEDIQIALTEKEKKWVELCAKRRNRKGRKRMNDRFILTAFCLFVRVAAAALNEEITPDELDSGAWINTILDLDPYDRLL